MVRDHFRTQAAACRELGSPFTAQLLELMAERLSDRTPLGRTILNWPGNPKADALALRLAGGLHALVLSGASPTLAAAYPRESTADDPEYLWRALGDVLTTQADFLMRFLDRPPQTNEVARAAVLAGGFLTVAAETGLPLALLEIGASAGLNLHWDAYAYDFGGVRWGSHQAPVQLTPNWRGNQPPLDPVRVHLRAGCDRNPINVQDANARLRLRAYVWADQTERLRRLDAALGHAIRAGLRIAQADAADWAKRSLAEMATGRATVLFHSIVWQYLPRQTQTSIKRVIEQAAARAKPDAPVAWLRMEPAATGGSAQLRLTLWPDGRERLLAHADFHGRWVAWEGD